MANDDDAVDPLQLHELLNENWLPHLQDVIKNQENVENFLGSSRPWTLPIKREHTFASLRFLAPESTQIVIFGQDPYPRPRSAIGIAFCDGAIRTWNDTFSPSFRNIMKNIFIHRGWMRPSDKIDRFRDVLATSKIVSPPHWFLETMRQGVLWLNTALTFSSTDPYHTKRHTDFWRPIIQEIIRVILRKKQEMVAQGENSGLVFVLWGGYAQKLKPMIERLNRDFNVPIDFVEAKHPAVEAFHTTNSFDLIQEALNKLGLKEMHWLPTTASTPLPEGFLGDSTLDNECDCTISSSKSSEESDTGDQHGGKKRKRNVPDDDEEE